VITLRFPELARPGHLEVLRAIGRMPGEYPLRFGGGTALSLVYFGHRISVDLGFFTGTRDDYEAGIQVTMNALHDLGYRFAPDFRPHHASMVVELEESKLKVDVLLEPSVAGVSCERLPGIGVWVLPLETLAALKIDAAIDRTGLDRLKDLFDLLVMDQANSPGITKRVAANRRIAGQLLQALEELDELVADLPRLRLQGHCAAGPEWLLERKSRLGASLMAVLTSRPPE